MSWLEGAAAVPDVATPQCPLCQWSGDSFKPFGEPARPNALCPRCESLERHRLVALFLQKYRPELLSDTDRLLHIAPEDALRPLLSSRISNYVAADLDDEWVVVNLRLDLLWAPFMPGAFDAVVCNHVLEHVVDDRRAMRELYRVIRPGGWAVLSVPLDLDLPMTLEDPSVQDPGERRRLFGQWDHLRKYGADYVDRLQEAGFTVELVPGRSEDAGRFGLMDNDCVVFCRRPG
jgi:SAM-dependent methyltransferase